MVMGVVAELFWGRSVGVSEGLAVVEGTRGLAVVSLVAEGAKIVGDVGAEDMLVGPGPSEGAAPVCASLLQFARVTAVTRHDVTGVKSVCTDATHG